MLDTNSSILIMIFASAFIGYYTMPIVLGINKLFSRNHLNKLYSALFMAIFMGFIEIYMMYDHMNTNNVKLWILLLTLSAIIMYNMIQEQTSITEKQFLIGMIEHHDMALSMSSNILKKENVSDETKKLAQNIINSQTAEIAFMDKLLKK